MTKKITAFQQAILAWYKKHGRKALPWQQPRTPYRVWISEIMLQQTQVATVVPYFQRFMEHYPNVTQLAAAKLEDVLALWAGLGYYSRARNLHRTAKLLVDEHQNQLPADLETLQKLPGIGRSTAGAILSLGFAKRAAILDGNVKRVLTRFHAIEGWPAKPAIAQKLWAIAEDYTPVRQVAAYTQAMMDLGATICTRTKSKCGLCPLQKACKAYAHNQVARYPTPKAASPLPVRSIMMLLMHDKKGNILLEKRPPVGIWGGLWSLPECPIDSDVKNWAKQYYQCTLKTFETWPAFRHTFSHFHLDILPVFASIADWKPPMMEPGSITWYNVKQPMVYGVATPIKKLLVQMSQSI